jgi:hypothetical protein
MLKPGQEGYFKKYSHCEGCGLGLDDYNIRIGSAYHKECWMKEVDAERYSKVDESKMLGDFEYRSHETSIYINGRRAKEWEPTSI